MLTFAIQPLVGAGPIKPGMGRSEVRGILAELGEPKATLRSPSTDCFYQNAFQVSYDEADKVQFIETAVNWRRDIRCTEALVGSPASPARATIF